jgi:hypothetical protein
MLVTLEEMMFFNPISETRRSQMKNVRLIKNSYLALIPYERIIELQP